jgi:hypothetical protein
MSQISNPLTAAKNTTGPGACAASMSTVRLVASTRATMCAAHWSARWRDTRYVVVVERPGPARVLGQQLVFDVEQRLAFVVTEHDRPPGRATAEAT